MYTMLMYTISAPVSDRRNCLRGVDATGERRGLASYREFPVKQAA